MLIRFVILCVVVTSKSTVVLAWWCEANGAPRDNVIYSCTNETKETMTSLYIEPKIEYVNGVIELVTCNCVLQQNTTEKRTLNVSVTVSGNNATFKFRGSSFQYNGSKSNYALDGNNEVISTEVLSTQTTCANLTFGHYFRVTCSDNVTRINASGPGSAVKTTTTSDDHQTGSSATSTGSEGYSYTSTKPGDSQTSSTTTTEEQNNTGTIVDFFKSDDDSPATLSSGAVGAIVTCCVLALLVVFGGVILYSRKNNLDGPTTFRRLLAKFTTPIDENDGGNPRTSVGKANLRFLYNKAYKSHDRMVEDMDVSDEECEVVMEETKPSETYSRISVSGQSGPSNNKSVNSETDDYDHLNNVPSKQTAEDAELNVYGMASGNPDFKAEENGEYDQLGSVLKITPRVIEEY